MSFLEQLRRNQLSIISLLVALIALGYNTWRNEQTEENRNIRQAGFEMIVHISALQRITYLLHYDGDEVGGNPRKGWAEVLVIRDLAALMPARVAASADELFKVWENNWAQLGKSDQAVQAIDTAVDDLRAELEASLVMLE